MDFIEVTAFSDDGKDTTRAAFVSRHILMVAEVHQSMIDGGDAPVGAKAIIGVREMDDPISVTDSYESVIAQL